MNSKEENIIVSSTDNKEKEGIAENVAAPSAENTAEKAKVVPPAEQNVQGNMPVPKKNKSYAGRIVALAVCCTLTGALLGAGGVIAFGAFRGHGRMRMGGFRQGAGVVRQFDRRNFGDNNANNSSGTRKNGNRPDRKNINRNEHGFKNKNSKSNYGNGFNGNRGQHGKNRVGSGKGQSGQQSQSGQQNNGNAQAPNSQTPAADTGNAN